jgi:hypothetical protein
MMLEIKTDFIITIKNQIKIKLGNSAPLSKIRQEQLKSFYFLARYLLRACAHRAQRAVESGQTVDRTTYSPSPSIYFYF